MATNPIFDQLDPSKVHVDALLSNYARVDYAPQNYFWTMFAPAVQVKKRSDQYLISRYDRRQYNTLRAPGTPAGLVNVSYATDTYFTEEYAAAAQLPDAVRENADDVHQLERRHVQQAKDTVWLDLEIQTRDLAEACTNSTAAGVAWDSTTNIPDPEKDVDNAKYAILGRIGTMPNKIKLSLKAWWALDRYLKAAANLTVTAPLMEKMDAVRNLWGLEPIITFNQVDKSSSGQTTVLSQIWSATECIVFYADEQPSLQAQGWMQTFVMRRGGDQSNLSEMVKTWYDDKTESTFYQYSIVAKPTVVGNSHDAAHKITAVIT